MNIVRQRWRRISHSSLPFWSGTCTSSVCSVWAHRVFVYFLLHPLPFELFSTHSGEITFLEVISQRPSLSPASLLLNTSSSPTTADTFWKLPTLTAHRGSSPVLPSWHLYFLQPAVDVSEGSLPAKLIQAFTFNCHLCADDALNVIFSADLLSQLPTQALSLIFILLPSRGYMGNHRVCQQSPTQCRWVGMGKVRCWLTQSQLASNLRSTDAEAPKVR